VALASAIALASRCAQSHARSITPASPSSQPNAQHAAGRIPRNGRNGGGAGALGDDLRPVLDAHQQQQTVFIADGHHVLFGVAGDGRGFLSGRREQLRRLAHRAVLGLKRPQDELDPSPRVASHRPPADQSIDPHFGGVADMRMCLPSTIRHPCSVGSCMAVTRKRPSGLNVAA